MPLSPSGQCPRSDARFAPLVTGGSDCRGAVGKLVVPCPKDGSAMGPSATISSTLSSALRISSASLSSKAIEEGSMDGEHLIVMCTLSNCEEKIRTHALIDTGATGF